MVNIYDLWRLVSKKLSLEMHAYKLAISTSERRAFKAEEIGYGQTTTKKPHTTRWEISSAPSVSTLIPHCWVYSQEHRLLQILNLNWSSTDWDDGLKPTIGNVTDVNVKWCMWVTNPIAQCVRVGWQLFIGEQAGECNRPHVGARSLLFLTGKKTTCSYYP